MSKKSFYHISRMELPLIQKGSILILSKSNSNSLCFIEEYFDSRDIDLVTSAKCIIRIHVTVDRAFDRHISYETGQILWTPKSEFMRCQVLSIDEYCNLPLYHCSWKTSKFICDITGN
jgi:hypothetical protein